MRWDITREGAPAWLVTCGFAPDLENVKKQLTPNNALRVFVPGRVKAIMGEMGALDETG